MNPPHAVRGLQLRSLITPAGELEIELVDTEFAPPTGDEVLVRVEATPINPSDIGLLFGPADLDTLRSAGTPDRPRLAARVPAPALAGIAGRLGQALPVGNEGAGVVVQAGADPAAQALLGKTVALMGGAMYAQFRRARAAECLVLPEGTAPAAGASCFVNPLTALGMVETMRREGHRALAHTAAASNLGQMLNRICIEDGIGLVNIVRRPEQAALLRALGARHVCDASAGDFGGTLTEAFAATGATIAFDAIGGGRLAGQILAAMEAALARGAGGSYSRYGTNVLKQVYIYGGLDTGPTEIQRSFGMTWAVGGWLLFPFLERSDPARVAALKARVAAGLGTTFASHYAQELSLAEALQPAAVGTYARRATGRKCLIAPQRGLARA